MQWFIGGEFRLKIWGGMTCRSGRDSDHARDYAPDESRRRPAVALAVQYGYSELSERSCWRSYCGADVGDSEANRNSVTTFPATVFSNVMNSKGPTMRGHITEKILNETYSVLKDRAKIDLDFLLLTMSAAVICALGFKMNSAAVIVGAMVISPLLYPSSAPGSRLIRPIGPKSSGPRGHLQWAFLPPSPLRPPLVFFMRRHSARRSSND